MDGSSDDESYCGSLNLEEGKREDTEHYYGGVEEEESTGSEDGEEQPWRIGHFKRFFPVKKHDTELPLASNKAYMEKRRPAWLPQFTVDETYFEQANYFSELLAKDQLIKQAIFDKYYKSKLGEYAYSSGDLVCRKYLNKYMKGAHCVRFSPGGKYIVIGCGNGTIQINNTRDKTTSVHVLSGFQRRITAVRFLPGQAEGPFFASSLTGRVYLGKQENEEWNCYTLLKEINNEINAMDLNCDGSFMATAGMDSHIRIYDPNNKKLTQMYLRPGSLKEEKKETTTEVPDSCHFRRICALKYHPKDSNVFITGGWDDLIKLWDVRTSNKPTMTIPGPHLQSNSIDIMGNVLLTGQWTCKEGIQMWDMRSTRCLKTVEPTNRPLNCSGQFINDVQFLHSWEHGPITIPGTVGDLLIAAGTGTKAVEVISIKENLILYRVEEPNAVVTVDHHKSYIVYGAVSHLYGIATFFPFAGELSRRMKFSSKNEEEFTLKHYSSGGNPMGWHEVAISLDFLDGVKEAEKVKEPDSGEGASGATEEERGTAEKPPRRGPGTYDIDLGKAYYKSLKHQNYYTTK